MVDWTKSITTRTNLFLLLNLVDFALTAILIKQGIGIEGNPMLSWMPFWGIGITKIIVVYLVARYLRNRVTLMILLNLGMSLVVVWNLGWLILLG